MNSCMHYTEFAQCIISMAWGGGGGGGGGGLHVPDVRRTSFSVWTMY